MERKNVNNKVTLETRDESNIYERIRKFERVGATKTEKKQRAVLRSSGKIKQEARLLVSDPKTYDWQRTGNELLGKK